MHNAGVRLPLLLQPIPLRGIFARNRIVVSPMYECAGIYSDDHARAYRRITDFIRKQGAVPASSKRSITM